MGLKSAVIEHADIREFFQSELDSVLQRQSVQLEAATASYLVNLLTAFLNARALFEKTDDGMQLKPLALHYADALAAPTSTERSQALRKLGDVALFISGLFSGHLNRKVVDVDYYIAMGGSAYSHVHEIWRTKPSTSASANLFAELAENFARLVDVLGEISDHSTLNSNTDVLRVYEIWLKTGSPRSLEKLRRLGLNVSENASSRALH